MFLLLPQVFLGFGVPVVWLVGLWHPVGPEPLPAALYGHHDGLLRRQASSLCLPAQCLGNGCRDWPRPFGFPDGYPVTQGLFFDFRKELTESAPRGRVVFLLFLCLNLQHQSFQYLHQ